MASRKTHRLGPPLRQLSIGSLNADHCHSLVRQHGTPDWHLIITFKGKGRITGSDQTIEVHEQDCLLLTPGQRHDYGMIDRSPWHYFWAHFTPLPHWLNWLRWDEINPGMVLHKIKSEVCWNNVTAAFQSAIDIAQSENPMRVDLAMNKLEEILIRIQSERRSGKGKLDSRINDCVDYIHQNLETDLFVPMLATRANMANASFSRLFAREVGKPPGTYIEHLRLSRACQLLTETNLKIDEIASAVGFNHVNYFCIRFKNINNVTPSEYRKNHRPYSMKYFH